jgi:hypothetical protein
MEILCKDAEEKRKHANPNLPLPKITTPSIIQEFSVEEENQQLQNVVVWHLVLVNILSRYFSVFIILENQYRIGDVVN